MSEIRAQQLAHLLADVPANMPVILEGIGPVTDWRGEVRDGQNVLVLYAGEAADNAQKLAEALAKFDEVWANRQRLGVPGLPVGAMSAVIEAAREHLQAVQS